MPRIPENELERLKSEISLQRLAEARGIELKAHGADLIGLCPFHDDHEPSLVISPAKNLWHCLGACSMGGSVIDWVMKSEGVSFRHAVEILRTGALPESHTPAGRPPKHGTVRKLPSPIDFKADDHELFRQVIEFYHQNLKQCPEALAYLEKRGIGDTEMINHFKIGYSNRTLGIRLPTKQRQTGAMIREKLQQVGILRKSGHEHFAGSIVFPVYDENGQVSEIYGRKIIQNLRVGTPKHTYLPGPHHGVFNFDALRTTKDIILCESIVDALTFWCAGLKNVTSSFGINGFTSEILSAFKRYEIERVYIAYDRDTAGETATKKLTTTLLAEGFECFRILFPRNMDANSFAQSTKPASQALDLVFRNATWLGRGKREEKAAAKEKNSFESQPAMAQTVNLEPLTVPQKQETPVFPLAASTTPKDQPQPVMPKTEIKDEEVIITIEDRRWRIRGLNKNMSYDQLKVNVLLSRSEAFFADTFDLYSARSRASFLKQAAIEFRIKEDALKIDLGKVFLKLEELQDKQIRANLEPKEEKVLLTAEEQKQAIEFLSDPKLFDRILEDFEKCGIVGEETNKLVGYLATISRKLEQPLAVIIQSSSAAGKTSLMESVLAFTPQEDRVKYSAMTGQSLFYMGETNLKHKILAIVEEEGAERASYALKLLQSEGELTIASTGKEPSTGKLITHEYHVEGPVMIFVTTTSIEIDEELQNRCIVLTVNESREQTKAIHKLQRHMETLDGLLCLRERDWIYKLHRNAQRLLKPLLVANPYAEQLTFLDDTTRSRRDHKKYLTLIRTIALLHQFQRPQKTTVVRGQAESYIEVSFDDIELANRLADEVLGRSLDELPPQTRRLLLLLEKMVLEGCERLGVAREYFRFSQREVREYTGFGNTQVKTHLRRLEELEYILAHRGMRGQMFSYELAYDGKGKDGSAFFHGLLDVEALRKTYGFDAKWAGQKFDQSALSRGEVMHLSGPGRVSKSLENEDQEIVSEILEKKGPKCTSRDPSRNSSSYAQTHHSDVSLSAAAKESEEC